MGAWMEVGSLLAERSNERRFCSSTHFFLPTKRKFAARAIL